MLLVGPTRQEEEGARFATKGTPIDAFESAEIGWTKVKRATVEQDGTAAFVNFPKASAVGAFLIPRQEVAVHIYASEFQNAVLVDDEFLVHSF